MGDLGGALFRHRLGVLCVAAAAGVAGTVLTQDLPAVPVLRSLVDVASLPVAFGASVPVLLIAFALRTAGEAHLGRVVYGQAAGPMLVTSGPFARMRNPLYAGTWLFFVGAFAPYLSPVLLAVFAAALAAVLTAIVRHEERSMAAVHGERFSAYTQQVAMFGLPLARAAAPASTPADTTHEPVPLTAAAYWAAALGNIGMLALAAYRALVAADAAFVGARALAALAMAVWFVVIAVRRMRAR